MPRIALASLLLVAGGVIGTAAASSDPPRMSMSRAQSAAAQAPRAEFEVASVKRWSGDERGPRGVSFSPGGRFAWSRMTLVQLMESAFADVNAAEVLGGPSWVRSDRFDIAATSGEALREIGPGGEPIGLFRRLKTLLEDRFTLRTHVEQRDRPVFAIRGVGRAVPSGPKLQRVDVDCEAVIRDVTAAGPRPVPEGQLPLCSLRSTAGHVIGRAISMSQLAGALSAAAGRPVVVGEGLAGTFDVDLSWAPELPPGALLNGAPAPPSPGPSLFTAVREQLGLVLQPTRATVPVLVVDAVSPPTPD